MFYIRWILRVFYKGQYKLITDSNHFRSQHYARASLLSRLKARIWSRSNPPEANSFNYELPDDLMHPDNLLDYRPPIGQKALGKDFEKVLNDNLWDLYGS